MSSAATVSVAGGRVLRVDLDGDEVVLELDGVPLLRLERVEAWALAEALERVATRQAEC